MKRILSILFTASIMLSLNTVHAAKLYVLCTGDMNEVDLERPINAGISFSSNVFLACMPENNIVLYNHSNDNGYTPWSGPDLTQKNTNVKSNLFRAIQNCPANSDDAIIVYWIGHGARNSQGHYFDLNSNLGPDKIYRADVISELKNKNVRLVGLISETCNVYDRYTPRPQSPFPPGSPNEIPPLFQKLFFDCHGVLDINSSSPDQTAMAHPIFGGYFTCCFFTYLYKNSSNTRMWDEVITFVDKNVLEYLTDSNKKHYQKISVLSLPVYGSGSDNSSSITWSNQANYFPENTDRIVELNGSTVYDEADFRRKVANAGTYAVMKIVDHRTGSYYYLRTRLLPQGNTTRLGIYVQTDSRGGVMVTGVMSGTPGSRCQTNVHNNNGNNGNNGNWSAPIFHPEHGDRIVEFNDSKVYDEADFRNKVANAGTYAVMKIVDHRTGSYYYLRTSLLPQGYTTRLGIYVQSDSRGGVVVTGVMANSPGTRCQTLDN